MTSDKLLPVALDYQHVLEALGSNIGYWTLNKESVENVEVAKKRYVTGWGDSEIYTGTKWHWNKIRSEGDFNHSTRGGAVMLSISQANEGRMTEGENRSRYTLIDCHEPRNADSHSLILNNKMMRVRFL